MNPIEKNAYNLLGLIVEDRGEQLTNDWLRDKSSLPPQDINDAVDYLESLGAIYVIKELGTHPFDFSGVMIQSRGRFLYHEIKEQNKEHNAEMEESVMILPTRPLNPVGSPYGFTEDDWLNVSLNKEDSNTLFVALGMQFDSNHYDKKNLIRNIRSIFQDAVQQYNERNRENKITLNFEPLAAGYGEHLFNDIARSIISSDIAVFETSDLNPNVMVEMGVALTWGVRLLPIKKSETEKPPSDISGQTWIDYEDSGSKILDEKFDRKIVKMIERVMAIKKRNSS